MTSRSAPGSSTPVEDPLATPQARIRLYGASKTEHAHLWREARTEFAGWGVDLISTWIDEAGEGESDDLTDLWVRCVTEATTADLLVAYYVEGDVWKGTFVEIGAALASGVPVYVVNRPPGSWIHHPLVTLCSTADEAVEDFRSRSPRSDERNEG